MAVFFIDTSTGQVATQRQLVEAGIAPDDKPPAAPVAPDPGHGRRVDHVVRGDAQAGRGACTSARSYIRHGDHHASLLQQGWEEVPVAEIAASAEL